MTSAEVSADWALRYLTAGLVVIPMVPGKKGRPWIESWANLRDDPPELGDALAWFVEKPTAGCGLVMGCPHPDGGFVFCLDIDAKGGSVDDAMNLLANRGIIPPLTPISRTPRGGRHIYLRAPERLPDFVGDRPLLGRQGHVAVELKGIGLMTEAPIVVEDGAYQWVVAPWESPIAEAPEALLAEVARARENRQSARHTTALATTGGDWVSTLLRDGASAGGRNAATARLAGYFLKRETPDVTLALLEPFAQRCQPPLKPQEVLAIVKSVAKTVVRNGNQVVATVEDAQDTDRSVSAVELAEQLRTSALSKAEPLVPVPFPGIAKLLGGGLGEAGDLIYLVARTTMGKSAIAMEITRWVSIKGYWAYIVSNELSNLQVGRRLASRETGVTSWAFRPGAIARGDGQLVDLAHEKIARHKIRFNDGVRSFEDLVRQFKQYQDTAGEARAQLLVVDYLQLLRSERRFRDRRIEIEEMSRGFKLMAKELKVVVLVVSSVRRAKDGAENDPPTRHDMRESGELEFDADTILILHRESPTSQTGKFIIDKARNAMPGEIDVVWDGEKMHWREIDVHHTEAGDAPPSREPYWDRGDAPF